MANVPRNSPINETPRAIRDLIEKGRRDRHLNESEVLALFDDPEQRVRFRTGIPYNRLLWDACQAALHMDHHS